MPPATDLRAGGILSSLLILALWSKQAGRGSGAQSSSGSMGNSAQCHDVCFCGQRFPCEHVFYLFTEGISILLALYFRMTTRAIR